MNLQRIRYDPKAESIYIFITKNRDIINWLDFIPYLTDLLNKKTIKTVIIKGYSLNCDLKEFKKLLSLIKLWNGVKSYLFIDQQFLDRSIYELVDYIEIFDCGLFDGGWNDRKK